MATDSSVDSSLGSGSFFSPDWFSPLDFISTLVGLECKQARVEVPSLVGEGCDEEVPAVTCNLKADKECLFQQAEQELLETVAAELRQEEEFLQNLQRGPSAMNQFDEAPRQARFPLPRKCMEDSSKLDRCFGPGWQSHFQQAEQELIETVAAELRQEEEFLRNLLRGPPAMNNFDEEAPRQEEEFPKGLAVTNQPDEDAFSEITRYLARRQEEEPSLTQSKATLTKDALRQQAKETLSDGFATGCFALALAKLKLSRESPESTSLRRLAKETLCVSATNGSLKAALAKVKHARIGVAVQEAKKTLCVAATNGSLKAALAKVKHTRIGIAVPVVSWDNFGRSLDLASEREEVRQEVREGADVETELPIEQPKATVDVEDLCVELASFEHSGLEELPSSKMDGLHSAMEREAFQNLIQCTTSSRVVKVSARRTAKFSKAAPTKSKQLTGDDVDQRDASPNGFVPAKVVAASPMKGKKQSSPKKGGS